MDRWEVRVDRGYRAEFKAWEGTSEEEARAQFEVWKEAENVDQVGLYVNGNLADIYQRKPKPGRPRQYPERERTSWEMSQELLDEINRRRGSLGRSIYIEQQLRQLWGMPPLEEIGETTTMAKALRFATPEEAAEAEALQPTTGYIQQQHDDYPPSPAQQEALAHPELYYCDECGASYASHVGKGHTK